MEKGKEYKMSYSITTKASWSQTQRELSDEFDKWGISEWTTNYPKGARLQGQNQTENDRAVTLSYTKNGKQINLSMDSQSRAVDNLRALYLSIQSMRLIEKRGLSEAVQSAYMQLDAPRKIDPYRVLGIMPESTLEIAESVYRTMARKYHPDSKPDGNIEKFKEIQEAIEMIRKEK